jgi:hypothetical protein
VGLLALVSWPLLGCQEELPTATWDDLIPVEAVTVEVWLSFDEFAENLRVYGGFGDPSELRYGLLAHDFEGGLEARTLVGFWPYPVSATVRDTTGTTRADSSLVFIGGRLVAHIDTIASIYDGPVELAAGAVQEPWQFGSTNWQVAVDTVGDLQPWPEDGAGPVIPLATAVWNPTESDSVIFELDSAAVALWNDTASAAQGVRLDALTDGVRLQAHTVRLFLNTRPSSNPDTLIDLLVQTRYRTFIYDPVLEAPESEMRVGGVPAWRTVFDTKFPAVLDGPPELCQQVGCPLELKPEMVSAASLYLTTTVPPPGFRPSDDLQVDVRIVLEPHRLPKSPLGPSLAGQFGVSFAPEYFGEEAGTRVEIPFGGYVVDLIRGTNAAGADFSRTVALLSSREPLSMPFGSFVGGGGPDEPELRLILTVGGAVEIR